MFIRNEKFKYLEEEVLQMERSLQAGLSFDSTYHCTPAVRFYRQFLPAIQQMNFAKWIFPNEIKVPRFWAWRGGHAYEWGPEIDLFPKSA